MGGIGKTAIALEYCCRHKNDYACRWWINAENENGIIEAYRALAATAALAVANKPDAKPEEIIAAVKHWLQECDNWLLIFDNAEPLFPAKGGSIAKTLRHYLPGQSDGRRHVLITSRNPNWQEVAASITVDVFTDKEASEFFRNRTGLEPDEAQRQLSEELGHLALALEQAAAYITANGKSYDGYLKLLRQNRPKMLRQFPGKMDNSVKPVYETWSLSIEKIKSANESAWQLLNLCAFFAADDIQLDWLGKGVKHLPEPLASRITDEGDRDEMTAALRNYSLITPQDDGAISLHRLVQEVVREALGEERDKWRDYCLAVLDECRFFDFSTVELRREFQQLARHIEAICGHGETTEQETLGNLYDFLGYGFNQFADYDTALFWYDQALTISEKVLGLEHPDTATSYNNIGAVYKMQSDYGKALEFLGKALAIREKVLELENPTTATTYSSIGTVYHAQSDYGKALEFHCKALTIHEKVLGREHPDTARTYHNIASTYNAWSDYDKALEFYNKALAIREEVLGKEHPDTAITYNDIAGLYEEQGQFTKALELHNKALAIKKKVLGQAHPSTATSYNNIAHVYSTLADYDKALEFYGKASAILEKVLSEEHPDTARTYNNIGLVYYAQSDYGKALEFYNKALGSQEKVVGMEHPDTATTHNNIACVYEAQGDYAKALGEFLKAYRVVVAKLGEGNPLTQTVKRNMKSAYEKTSNPQAFDEWLRQALAAPSTPE